MNYIGKVLSNFKEFYSEINSATLTGAIDVVVVQQPDGTYVCSPFHVRFGKIGVLRSREKVVDIEVNGDPVNIHMKLGESGEAFFVEEVEDENEIPLHLATSPLPLVPDIQDELEKLKSSKEKLNESHIVVSSANDAKLSRNQSTNYEGVNPSHNFNELQTDLKSSEEENDHVIQAEKSDPDSLLNEVTADSNGQDFKGKRRKRKKVAPKKRAKSRDINIPNTVFTNDAKSRTVLDKPLNSDIDMLEQPEDIFQMDDDYGETDEDEGYDASHGLIRSISLPLNGNQTLTNEWPTRKMSSTFTGEFHPFSDGDVTPHSSPCGSRPPSPKSDTEYENQKQVALNQDSEGPSWNWGELPQVPSRKVSVAQQPNQDESNTTTDTKVEDSNEDEKRSMLSGMLNFMRSTKKMRRPQSEGIYLDSINVNALDPEVAALYFPKFSRTDQPEKDENIKDEDQDSGKGPSLPHSPPNTLGVQSNIVDCDMLEHHDTFGNIAMSLCGGLPDTDDAELPEERFTSTLVTYEQFTENPALLMNPNLVIRLGSKYYNWQTAAPMLISMIVFQRLLPEKTTNQLINEHMPKKKKSKYTSWWSWRRSNDSDKPETLLDAGPSSVDSNALENNEAKESDAQLENLYDWDQKMNESVETMTDDLHEEQEQKVINEDVSTLTVINEAELFVTEASSDTSSTLSLGSHDKLEKTESLTLPETSLSQNGAKEFKNDSQSKPKEVCKKSLRLTSEQIASLNLVNGPNEVVFSVTTAYQGTTRCKCDIYLWKYDDKIVISDIDGTITKSDVLGHILPMVGKDWAQLGVAKLFTKVKNNGYQLLYLSARAIGQARTTREYLRSIRQGEVCLPDGPLFLSPTSLLNALHREVIEKKPEEFKISCLKDVQALFPNEVGNPFFAGFGNKINDTWAYCTVGIPKTRVFTINHRGELTLELAKTFQSSYTSMSDRVDQVFPALSTSYKVNERLATSFTSSEEFSFFTYWREPLDSINPEDELSA